MIEKTQSHSLIENLIRHLEEFEDQRQRVLDEFYPMGTLERRNIEQFFENYIEQINNFIKNPPASKASENSLSFVIVGAKVAIENLEKGSVHRLQVVSPFQVGSSEKQVSKASYLSPVGNALLLKKVGDEVEVKAPAGVYRYRVKSIELPYN